MSDDEVKVIVKAKKANTAASKQPALQLFVVSSSVYTHLHHSQKSEFIHFRKANNEAIVSFFVFLWQ